MTSVLLRQGGEIVAAATDPALADDADDETTIPLGEGADIYLRGRELQPADRRVLGAFVAQLETALVQRRLTTEAADARPLAEADRLRRALLAAVGHDLRRPLASATTAVSCAADDEAQPRRIGPNCSRPPTRASTRSAALVTDLLDASRIQAGVLGVSLTAVALDDVVGGALDELDLAPGDVTLELAAVPPVDGRPGAAAARRRQRADQRPALLTRRAAPRSSRPASSGDRVQLRIIDAGPGIPPDAREDVFVPFQRLGDTDNHAGVGLGLALSKGFVEAMGGTLEAEDTPGGGLTMVIDLAAAK